MPKITYIENSGNSHTIEIANGLIDAYKEIIPALTKQREDASYFIKKDIPQLQNV